MLVHFVFVKKPAFFLFSSRILVHIFLMVKKHHKISKGYICNSNLILKKCLQNISQQKKHESLTTKMALSCYYHCQFNIIYHNTNTKTCMNTVMTYLTWVSEGPFSFRHTLYFISPETTVRKSDSLFKYLK